MVSFKNLIKVSITSKAYYGLNKTRNRAVYMIWTYFTFLDSVVVKRVVFGTWLPTVESIWIFRLYSYNILCHNHKDLWLWLISLQYVTHFNQHWLAIFKILFKDETFTSRLTDTLSSMFNFCAVHKHHQKSSLGQP